MKTLVAETDGELASAGLRSLLGEEFSCNAKEAGSIDICMSLFPKYGSRLEAKRSNLPRSFAENWEEELDLPVSGVFACIPREE